MTKINKKILTEDQAYIMNQLYSFAETIEEQMSLAKNKGFSQDSIEDVVKTYEDTMERKKVEIINNIPGAKSVEVNVDDFPTMCEYLFEYLDCKVINFIVSNKTDMTPISIMIYSEDTQTIDLLKSLNKTKLMVIGKQIIVSIDT